MRFSEAEFNSLINDQTKTINGDISWQIDADHPSYVVFRVDVENSAGYPLFIAASYNYEIPALTFSLIHRGAGRIYGLCYGKDHHNPDCHNVGIKHKHRWTDSWKDKEAYVPTDITSRIEEVAEVWEQFCVEACLVHNGIIESPPPYQEVIF